MRTSDDGISVLPEIRTDGHHTEVAIFLQLRNQSVEWQLECDVAVFASGVSLLATVSMTLATNVCGGSVVMPGCQGCGQ
jgi:hypothetical protein